MLPSRNGVYAARALRLALGIGALYVVVGATWIFASDGIVVWMSADPAWLLAAQRYKGLLYIAVTAAALVLLVRAGYLRLLGAAEQARSRELQVQAQFRQLHQSLGEVLWLARADVRDLVYVSPAFEGLYGRPVAEFLRDPGLWLAAVHPEDRERAAASARQLRALGSSSCEYRICRPDGSIRWVADRKKAIVDDTGLVQLIGGIAEDITAQKERDAARAMTQDKLESMVAERTTALERVNAELDAFARTAAHDMKSPLNAIAGYSQLVQHKYGPHLGAEGSAMVARIEQASRDMATLINDLLSLSRLTSAELLLRDVDLAGLGREIVAGFRYGQPQRRVSFEAPASLVVRCDAGLARSLMANLLGNAWKFTSRQDEAWIRLAAADTGHGMEVCVQDNGAGFDIGDGEHLFKPFKRFHTAAEFSGTGLGLVTCQRIVQRHGGEIRVESAPGQGTAIHFTLGPAARTQGAAAPPGVPQPRVVRPPARAADPDPSAGTAVGEAAHPSGD